MIYDEGLLRSLTRAKRRSVALVIGIFIAIIALFVGFCFFVNDKNKGMMSAISIITLFFGGSVGITVLLVSAFPLKRRIALVRKIVSYGRMEERGVIARVTEGVTSPEGVTAVEVLLDTANGARILYCEYEFADGIREGDAAVFSVAANFIVEKGSEYEKEV